MPNNLKKEIPIITGFTSYDDLRAYANTYSGRDKILVLDAITQALKTVTNIERNVNE